MSTQSHVTAAIHLDGDIAPEVRFYTREEASSGRAYGVVGVTGDFTLFINEPGQAQALADAFADVADHFGTDPIRTYVLRRAREAVAEFRGRLAEPVTDGPEDGHPRQYRYAEFAGRLATLVDELTDTPEVPASPEPPVTLAEDYPAPVPPAEC